MKAKTMAGSDIRETVREKLEEEAFDEVAALLKQFAGKRQLAARDASYVASRVEELRSHVQLKLCRVAFVRSFTVEPLLAFLKARCFNASLIADVQVGDFNTYAQDFLNPKSNLYEFEPDVVIVSTRTQDVVPALWHGHPSENREAAVDETLANFSLWLETFRKHSQAHVVLHNFELPPFPADGISDAQQPFGQKDAIRHLNQGLRNIAQQHTGIYMLDYDGLVARYGHFAWHDERKWLTMRMPIAADYLLPLVDEYMRFIRPLMGKVSKALVVDLDNTLWGGVIGEEGMDGIQVGIEYPGAAYRSLQQVILNLYHRGIILAISSKNNPDDAIEALKNHPGMLLRLEHFAAMRINWNDKAENLKQIAEELNIGVDSLAFLDDNPVEREWVANRLPEVTVIDLPDDPMLYARTLQDTPVFEQVTLSKDDRKRSQYYSEQRQRAEVQKTSASLEEFYQSLGMVAQIVRPSPLTIPRIAQLTQKTNQFNLTTRRYSEQEIGQIAEDSQKSVYALRVTDRFGDNGIVGVAILDYGEGTCEVDTFLLSCRVIGRTVETALLSYLTQQARERGAHELSGWYLPTKKNAPASDFYETHGFSRIETENGKSRWLLDLTTHTIDLPDWIKLHEVEYEKTE